MCAAAVAVLAPALAFGHRPSLGVLFRLDWLALTNCTGNLKPFFGRTTNDNNRPPPVQICLDDHPAEAGFLLSGCGHTYCRACLKAFVTSKVNDAEVGGYLGLERREVPNRHTTFAWSAAAKGAKEGGRKYEILGCDTLERAWLKLACGIQVSEVQQ